MKTMRLAVVGVVAACAGLSEAKVSQTVTPVEKVLELLKSLSAKTTAEGKKDAASYDKYACFCKEQADEKLYAVEKSEKKIGKLDAKINELKGEIAELNAQISGLSVTISEHEAEIKTMTEHSDTAHAGYVEQEAELAGCIDALARAMKAMSDAKKGQDSDLDLAQIRHGSNFLRPDAKITVIAALQKLTKPGEAASYTYQSNDIIATLQDLLRTFKENHKEMEEEEFARMSAFEKKKLAFQNELKFSEKDKSEREAIVEDKNEVLKADEKTQSDETVMKGADQNFLDVLTEDCQTKANEWDARSSMRASELTTLAEAMTTLKEGAAENYSANKKLSGLQKRATVTKGGHWEWVEGPKAISFLQMRGSNAAPQKAIQVLSLAAARLKSDVLSAAVMKMTVSADHFVKVRALIKDLISRLEDNAEAEQTQKAFCDDGMAEATASRDEANSIIEDKMAAVSVAESEVAELKQEISDLEKGIAYNMKTLNEATELRNGEKAENEKTIEDATAGHEAVEFAITLLQQFYESAFLQANKAAYTPPNADRSGNTLADLAPKVMAVDDDRAQAASKGIIGLLDVILSDFENTMTKVREDETAAQAGFETVEADTKTDNEAKQGDIDSKETRLTELSDEIIQLTEDKKNGEQQQVDAKKKLSELKPMCVEGEETYAARVQKRQKEIEALKEAMTILDEWQK